MAKNFSLLHSVQTFPGTHLASYPMGTRVLSPRVHRPGREADHSPLSSAEDKNNGAISVHVMVLNYLSTGTDLPFYFYILKESFPITENVVIWTINVSLMRLHALPVSFSCSDPPNNRPLSGKVQIMKDLSKQFFAASCYFHLLARSR
jgi:hypothetical protein